MKEETKRVVATLVDWTPFDQLPESTCYCRCSEYPGTIFRSHAKAMKVNDGIALVTRNPETFTIRQ